MVSDEKTTRVNRSHRKKAHRGGAVTHGDQQGIGEGEVDPPRPSLDPASVVGAATVRGVPGVSVRVACERFFLGSEEIPYRGDVGERAPPVVRHSLPAA